MSQLYIILSPFKVLVQKQTKWFTYKPSDYSFSGLLNQFSKVALCYRAEALFGRG